MKWDEYKNTRNYTVSIARRNLTYFFYFLEMT